MAFNIVQIYKISWLILIIISKLTLKVLVFVLKLWMWIVIISTWKIANIGYYIIILMSLSQKQVNRLYSSHTYIKI